MKRSVYFIGNSATYYNDMPEIFKRLSASVGIDVEYEATTRGGASFSDYLTPADKDGALIFENLGSKKFDFVFLQDQTKQSVIKYADFYSGMKKIGNMAKDVCKKVILYHPIPAPAHSDIYKAGGVAFGFDPKSFSEASLAAHTKVAKEFKFRVAPAGQAFLDVLASNPEIPLYFSHENHHPSPEASYLIALTLMASAFRISPLDVTYDMELCADTVGILKEAAARAVFKTVK